MINKTFGWNRFLKVLTADILVFHRSLLLGASALLVGIVLMLALFSPGVQDLDGTYQFQFSLLTSLGVVYLGASAFFDLRIPTVRPYVLLLPASRFERFLSRWLLTGPAFFIAVLTACFLGSLLWSGLSTFLAPVTAMPMNPFSAELWSAAPQFFFMHSVCFFGGLYFRRHPLLKTFLLACVFGLSMMIVSGLIVFAVFADQISASAEMGNFFSVYVESDALSATLSVLFTLTTLATVMLLGWASYARFVESEA